MSDEGKSWNINTILLAVILTGGGAFCTFLASRSIGQGETMAKIEGAMMTRAEVENKLNAAQISFGLQITSVQTELTKVRANLSAIEVNQAAVAAALLLKATAKEHP